MTQIEMELQKVTGISYNDGDERQDYLVRLMKGAYSIEEGAFNKLTKATQSWVNNAINAHNDELPLVDFKSTNGKADGHDDPPATTQEDIVKPTKAKSEKGAKVKKEAATSKKANNNASKEAKPAKEPVKAKAKKMPKIGKVNDTFDESNKPSRRVGAQSLIKRLVLKDPQITVNDLVEKVTKQGYEVTRFAASTIRSGFRHSIKIIQEEGLLKNLKL